MNFRTFRQSSAVLAIVLCASACARRNAAEHVKKAQTYYDAQQYSEAALEYRNALQKDAQNGDIHLKLADTYMHLSDARNALRVNARRRPAAEKRRSAARRVNCCWPPGS
jgi:thioredoxin-like negative regulator of GroEL